MSRWLLVLALLGLFHFAATKHHPHKRVNLATFRRSITEFKKREKKLLAAGKKCFRKKQSKRRKGFFFNNSFDDILPKWDLKAAYYPYDNSRQKKRLKSEKERHQKLLKQKKVRSCDDPLGDQLPGIVVSDYSSSSTDGQEGKKLDGEIFELSESEETFEFPIVTQSWHFGNSATASYQQVYGVGILAMAVGLGLVLF